MEDDRVGEGVSSTNSTVECGVEKASRGLTLLTGEKGEKETASRISDLSEGEVEEELGDS